jgi:DNA-binding transcriptional MerR regulator
MSITFREKNILSAEEIDLLTDAVLSEELPQLTDAMEQARYSINDLKIAPRDATYWDKQEILPKIKGPGLRRKYTLAQSIWIKLIQQMRSLGISLNTIKELKDNLLEPKIDVNQLDPQIVMQILSKVSVKLQSEVSPEQLLHAFIEDAPSVFNSTVFATIIFRKRLHCIVNKDGEYLLYEASQHNELLSLDEEFAEFVSQPYFCLSFAEAYRSLINEWSPEPFLSKTSLLTKTELEILELIRDKKVNSITIRLKDGKPYLLEIDEKYDISMEQRFLDVIAKNGYQKITVKTQKGKIVDFENKILKKLNDGTK